MRRSLSTLAATALIAGVSCAHANTVRLDNYSYTPAATLSVSGGPSYTGQAGQFTGTLDGHSFLTFCTDLYQTFSFGKTYTDYSVMSGVSAWGAAKSTEMDHLMSYLVASHAPFDGASSAAAQAAVWEVIYETGSSYGFSSGSFKASSTDALTKSFLSNADWAAIAATPITVHANKLYSADHQDFVVLTPVPEPSTWAMLALGLVGIGATTRRRLR